MALTIEETPFSLVYARIADVLTTSTDLMALVAVDNVVRYDRELAPLIDSRNVGDLPSIELVPAGFTEQNLWDSNDTAMIMQTIDVMYKTGQEQAAAKYGLWAVRWAMVRALFRAGANLGLEDTVESWELGAFESNADWIESLAAGLGVTDEQGWHATASLTILLKIQHSEM